MRTFAAIAGMLAACGAAKPGGSEPTPKPDGGADTVEPALPTKLLHVALEYVVLDPDLEPPTSRVSLILTDETGAARREIIGEFPGGCSDVSVEAKKESLEPILGLDCWWSGTGVRLRFVKRRGFLNVLRAAVDEDSEEVSFEPLKRIELPSGTPIKTDYDS